MSAFQVSVTPAKVRNARNKSVAREPTVVVMAPFSAKSIAAFEDVPVTKTAKRLLEVINPTEQVLEVHLSKTPNPELGISLEWTAAQIPPQGCARLELVWSPTVVITQKVTVQLMDQRQFKKDVIIILKSVDKTQTTKAAAGPTAFRPVAVAVRPQSLQLVVKKPKSPKQKTGAIPKVYTLPARRADEVVRQPLGAYNPVPLEQPPHQPRRISPQPIADKENQRHQVASHHQSPNLSAMLNDFVFTPNAGAAPFAATASSKVTPAANFSTLIGQIQFTPDAAASQSKVPDETPKTHVIDQNYWAMTTPQEPVVGMAPAFNPTLCSTTNRGLTPNSDSDSLISRRKLFGGEHQHFELPTERQFHFQLSPDRRPPQTSPQIATQKVVLFTATTLSPRPASRGSVTASPSRIGLSMISEETMVDRNATHRVIDPAPGQHTFVVDANSPKQSPPGTIDIASACAGTPLRKKYESMRNLAPVMSSSSTSTTAHHMLRNNQGSMPNLNDIQVVRPIENNRYFYQHKEHAQSARNLDQVPRSLCSSASSMASNARSVHDINFSENEILAESSRFNLNRCHESAATSNAGLTYRLDYTPSLEAIPHTTNARGTFAVPHAGAVSQPSTSHRRVLSAPRVPPIIQTTSPTPPRNAQSKRMRADAANSSGSITSSTQSLRRTYTHSPPKRSRTGRDTDTSADSTSTASSLFGQKAGGFLGGSPLRATKSTSSLAKGETSRVRAWSYKQLAQSSTELALKQQRDKRVKLFDAEMHMQSVINPDPFAATITTDPFMAATMYLDTRCVERHEQDFIKWLNALLTIPADLNATAPAKPIDFGTLFQNVRNHDVTLAQSKDVVSSNYFTRYRLDGLRRAAIRLYCSDEIRVPIERLAVQVERGAIRMRGDRDLHRDIVRQREMLELLHCMNPMWLRLGLEVVFGEQIFMKNNQDVMSLSYFIVNRLFRDADTEQRHNRAYVRSDEYAEHVKRFTLKKMLFMLVFLDKAKQRQIVTHNPCLFLRASPYKETKDILLKFASAMIGNIGDVQKELRRIGIVLSHKQTYLDEFDYAVRSVAVDLRDGVRLTKVMEIIAMRTDLMVKLRVPAISRLQRVHNVELALQALREAGYEIKGGITGADIADGYREKTLSLLWQLIYAFRAPMFNEAAKTIQSWWRHSGLRVCIARRIRAKRERRRLAAATVIQAFYRGFISRKYCRIFKEQRCKAATTIQAYARRYLTLRRFGRLFMATLIIQRQFRAIQDGRAVRHRFLAMRTAAICVQRFWRGYCASKRLPMELAALRKATVAVQQRFRAQLAMRRDREAFVRLRQSVVCVQQQFRAIVDMRGVRLEFLELKQTTVFVQRCFRANAAMRVARYEFTTLRRSVIVVQTRFRAQCAMRAQRLEFVSLRNTVIFCQRRFRALRASHQQQQVYKRLRLATIFLQSKWRGQQSMNAQRIEFERLRSTTIWCQRHFRGLREMHKARETFTKLRQAAVVIQRRFRAQLQMRHQRSVYQTLCSKATFVQQLFRANRLCAQQRAIYLCQQSAVVCIQRRFRALVQMRAARSQYLDVKAKTIFVQRLFRANAAMRRQRSEYKRQRIAIVVLQTRLRAQLAMIAAREAYQRLRAAAVWCQRHFRADKAMQKQRNKYETLRNAAIYVQRQWRANREARAQRIAFVHLKAVTIYFQRLFRANHNMMVQRCAFLCLRESCLQVQRRFRAQREMRAQLNAYQTLRSYTIRMQRLFRANRMRLTNRNEFVARKTATLCIQRRFRALLAMRTQRMAYVTLRESAICVQRRFRALLQMRHDRQQYQELCAKVLFVQRLFRANQLRDANRAEYVLQRKVAICIQRRLRATLAMRSDRSGYLELRAKVVFVQRLFRANVQCRNAQFSYETLKTAAVTIQLHFRSYLLAKHQRADYLMMRNAVVTIQSRFRAQWAMKIERNHYQTLCQACVAVQRRFRAIKAMREQRCRYLQLRESVILVQQRFRSLRAMRHQRQQYTALRNAAICVQQRYRALKSMQQQRYAYQQLRSSTVCIQRHLRATLAMRSVRQQYQLVRCLVVCLQRRFRARRAMLCQRSAFVELRGAVTAVQDRFRGKLLMRQDSGRFQQIKAAMLGLQARCRGWLARERYQAMLTPELLQHRRRVKSARLVQRVWRGYVVRRRETRHMERIRLNVQELARCVEPQMMVRNRIMHSVRLLKGRYTVLEELRILRELVRISREVPQTLIADAKFIADFCYAVMSQAIRSEVDKDIIELCSCVILNLSRFVGTKEMALQSHGLETVAQMLLRWSNKECGIFNTLCSVIYVQAQNDEMKQIIRHYLSGPDTKYVLAEIKKLVIRKENMRNRRAPNPLMPKLSARERFQVPMLRPDFGLRSAQKTYVFVCSVFAFDTIMDQLGLTVAANC